MEPCVIRCCQYHPRHRSRQGVQTAGSYGPQTPTQGSATLSCAGESRDHRPQSHYRHPQD